MFVNHTQVIPAPLEQVAEVLCAEAYNVEVERGREGVVNTRFELTHKDDQVLRFVLHSREYARKKTGGLDKKTQVPTSMTSHYSVKDRVLTWDYRDGNNDKRFVLRGTYRLYRLGEQTRMEHQVEIAVRIPLIGRQIAKFIARQFETDLPRYQAVMQKHLAG